MEVYTSQSPPIPERNSMESGRYHKNVEDTTRIHFWLDNWCVNVNLVTLLNISDISQIDTSLMVSHFVTDAKEWDVMKLKELLDDIHLQLILATPIPFNPMSDSVCWGLSGNRDFSTKTEIWAAHGLNIKNSPSWEYSWIWHLNIIPILKVFLWQLCHAPLPTRGVLLSRGLQINPICALCNATSEDMDHLFL